MPSEKSIFISFCILLLSKTMCAQTTTEPIKYLALGDSYTIGESVTEDERWPVQLAKALNSKDIKVDSPVIIATTGWRTDNLKNAINIANLKEVYGMVSLLIGVNNQYQGKLVDEYAIEFEDLLKTAIQLAGSKRENVFVVSIPDYGYTPFGKPKQVQITTALNEFNVVNKRITKSYGIDYFDITDISRRGLVEPGLVAADGLHPSGRQYALWVARILEGRKISR